MCFTARQGLRRAIQRQVLKADINQKAQPFTDLPDDAGTDFPLVSGQGKGIEKLKRGFDGHRRQLMNRTVTDEHMTCGCLESAALAVFTGLGVEVARKFLADRIGFGLAVAALHVRDDPFETVCPPSGAPAVRAQITEVDFLLAAAVQDDVPNFFRQTAKRLFNIEVVMLSQAVQHLEIKGIAPVPSGNRTSRKTQGLIMNDPVGIKELAGPKAVAFRTGAGRVVK